MEKSRSLSIAVRGLFVSAFLSTIFGVANASAYTVTYNANGALFDNGQETNVVEYDDNHNVVSGEYKEPTKYIVNSHEGVVESIFWSSDEHGKNEINLSNVSEDKTLYAQYLLVKWDFDFTGNEQSFTTTLPGKYTFRVWGAAGGDVPQSVGGYKALRTYEGGYGGYSVGTINILKNKTLYINNGGRGEDALVGTRGTYYSGGYNGGGNSSNEEGGPRYFASGGGATHVAFVSGELATLEDYKGSLIKDGNQPLYYVSDEIIIVAGGGGGAIKTLTDPGVRDGGNGGGYKGTPGLAFLNTSNIFADCGIGNNVSSQTSGFAFGLGASHDSGAYSGGGGGFYGGGASGKCTGGGSGYIANSGLYDAHMAEFMLTDYYNFSSNDEWAKTVNTELVSENPEDDSAKKENGYTKLSYSPYKAKFIGVNNEDVAEYYVFTNKITAEDYPDKTGYKFAWYLGDEEFDFDSDVTGDIVLVGKYTPLIYNLTYNLNDSSVSGNPSTYTIETDDITLNNPTAPDYYDFLGWSGTDLTGDRNLTVTIPKGSIGDREYTANIAPTPYTITYNLDGGTNGANNPTEYNYESSEIVLARPTKEGYTFLGWSGTGIDGEDNLDVTIPVQSHGNREYTAHWSINEYTATFDANGGTAADPASITSNYGVAFGTLPTTSRTGYDFDGWFTEQTGGTEISDVTTMPAEDHTYYAHWTIQTFNISYDLNGGELAQGASNPDTYTYESADINLAKPSREGYTFLGWSGTNLTDNTEDVTIAHNSLGDRSYKAEFQINEYTATFDANAGETANPETITKNYNEELGNLPTTSRLGYKFLGWFTDATAGDEITDATKMPAGDVTYYAHWKIITYTIEYDLGGEDMDSAPSNDASNPTSYTVEDADITLKAATPGDTWHYFVGWALDRDTEDSLMDNFIIDTAEAKNIKVYAIFQANPYTVTLDPENGDEKTVKTVRGDQEIGELPTPEKAGYEFLGWFVGDKQIDEHFHPRSDSIAVARWEEIPTVPDTGANSTPNTGDAIMNHIVTFAVCTLALFIVVALRKRKSKNEA